MHVQVWVQDRGDKMPTMVAGVPPKDHQRTRPGFSCKFYYNKNSRKLLPLRSAFPPESALGQEVRWQQLHTKRLLQRLNLGQQAEAGMHDVV